MAKYKIIFVAMSAEDPLFENSLEIIDKTFSTLSSAKNFMKEVEFPRCKEDWESGFEEEALNAQETTFGDRDTEFVIEQNYLGHLCYRYIYKIVEIK